MWRKSAPSVLKGEEGSEVPEESHCCPEEEVESGAMMLQDYLAAVLLHPQDGASFAAERRLGLPAICAGHAGSMAALRSASGHVDAPQIRCITTPLNPTTTLRSSICQAHSPVGSSDDARPHGSEPHELVPGIHGLFLPWAALATTRPAPRQGAGMAGGRYVLALAQRTLSFSIAKIGS